MSTAVAAVVAAPAADLAFPPEAAVTDAAKDLIRRLLEPEPDRRATAVDALRHAWLCGGEVLPVSDGAPRSRARLRREVQDEGRLRERMSIEV